MSLHSFISCFTVPSAVSSAVSSFGDYDAAELIGRQRNEQLDVERSFHQICTASRRTPAFIAQSGVTEEVDQAIRTCTHRYHVYMPSKKDAMMEHLETNFTKAEKEACEELMSRCPIEPLKTLRCEVSEVAYLTARGMIFLMLGEETEAQMAKKVSALGAAIFGQTCFQLVDQCWASMQGSWRDRE